MKRHRIFVAINIPKDIRIQLLRWCDEWRDLPIRWTKEENIHITLLFIGGVNDEELSHIVSALPLAVEDFAPFEITLSRIGAGPNPAKPRMIWAEGDVTGELTELQNRVERTVFADGKTMNGRDDEGEEVIEEGAQSSSAVNAKAAQRKLFRLHVTLGRMMPFQWEKLGKSAPRIEKAINTSFPISSVELMESELGSGGPMYTVLSSLSRVE